MNDAHILAPDKAKTVAYTDADAMIASFGSILFPDGASIPTPVTDAPEHFRDLNLDQIVASVTAGREEYDLAAFFQTPLAEEVSIRYRQAVMRDLDVAANTVVFTAFAKAMRTMREQRQQAAKLYYEQQKRRWLLHAAQTYCDAVEALRKGMIPLALTSSGLTGLRDFIIAYADSPGFQRLRGRVAQLVADLATIRYNVVIGDGGFRVFLYDGEADYSADVAETFAKFRQGDARDYRVRFHDAKEMNHIEAKILEFVALLQPEIFGRLARFAADDADFAHNDLVRFDREVQFYFAYLEHVAVLRRAGLSFCLPEIAVGTKEIHDEDGFDLALAAKLVTANRPVVTNSFRLSGKERIIVISGPNQGGKTTLARSFGQMHHLAAIGCPVPGTSARLFLFDAVYTHFEREENLQNLRGKLQDDLMRIHAILSRATPRSIVIMNEIFNSTALRDAVFLGHKVIERIIDLDLLCVCVTFLEELTAMSDSIVSMVSTVNPVQPAERTFRVIRRPADGNAYASSIAEKYHLTRAWLSRRLTAPAGGGSR